MAEVSDETCVVHLVSGDHAALPQSQYDPYDILGVTIDEDVEAISRAFQQLTMVEEDAERRRRIRWAFELLSDPRRRREYDEQGIASGHTVEELEGSDPLRERREARSQMESSTFRRKRSAHYGGEGAALKRARVEVDDE